MSKKDIKKLSKSKKVDTSKNNSSSKSNSKSRYSVKSTKEHKVRSRTFMAQQQINPKLYQFAKLDKLIVSLANKIGHRDNVTIYACGKKIPSHYIYVALNRWYYPYVRKVGTWNDYKKLFEGTIKQQANKLMNRWFVRCTIGYFIHKIINSHFSSSKSGKYQTNVVPPEIAMIMHNKDKSSAHKGYVKPHIHIIAKFPSRVHLTDLAKWLGIAPNNVQTHAKGKNARRYEWDNMNAYIIHAKQNKHSYPVSDVQANYDYAGLVKKHMSDWHKYSVTKVFQGKSNKAKLNETWQYIATQMANHKMTTAEVYSNKVLFIAYIYHMMNRGGFSVIQQIEYDRQLQIRRNKKDKYMFYCPTYFITGDSGAGKTYLAKKIIKKFCKHNGLDCHADVFIPSSGKNPFDDYKGEPVLFIDEARSNCYDAQSFIDVIDQTPRELSARYHNSLVVPRLIIITTIQPSLEFFSNLHQQAQSEQLGQFYRRIAMVVKIYRDHKNPLDRKVGLYRPCFVEGGAVQVTLPEGFGGNKKRSTQYYLTPRPRSVEVPAKTKGLQWTYAPEHSSWLVSEDTAANKLAQFADKSNDYKHHSNKIKEWILGGWPTSVDYNKYVQKSSIEQKVDEGIYKAKKDEFDKYTDPNYKPESESNSEKNSDYADDSNPF